MTEVIFFFFDIWFFFVRKSGLIQKKSQISLKRKKISLHIEWLFFFGKNYDRKIAQNGENDHKLWSMQKKKGHWSKCEGPSRVILTVLQNFILSLFFG